MIVIGITGSIGMGKSTAGTMLQSLGIPVHDADACVHELLQPGSVAWTSFAAAFPYFSYPQIYTKKILWMGKNGINRQKLAKLVFEDDELRQKLEAVLHPFVQKNQQDFIRAQQRTGRDIAALDIPLLFETGADKRVDYTINISAPAFLQKKRVLARPGMTFKKLHKILQRQMPDGEKSARADFVVHSGLGRAAMMKQLKQVLADIRAQQNPEEETA